MDKKALIRVVDEVAVPRGYRRRGALYWRPKGELTTLLYLERSRWGPAFTVELGVMLTKDLGSKGPPKYAGFEPAESGTGMLGPHFQTFCRLARDYQNRMVPEKMRMPIRWALSWLDRRLGNADWLRDFVLDGLLGRGEGLFDPRSTIAGWAISRQSLHWKLLSWPRVESISARLEGKLHARHPLQRLRPRAIAYRSDHDNVLAGLSDGRLAAIRLTRNAAWTSRTPRFKTVRLWSEVTDGLKA